MTLTKLMSSVLPGTGPAGGNLACAELYSDPPGLSPMAEEEPLIARGRLPSGATSSSPSVTALGLRWASSASRLRRFSRGTRANRVGPTAWWGQPHPLCGYRGAVVGRAGIVRSLGVDAEPHDVLPDGVLDAISLPAERAELAALPTGVHWDRILFCAKEATYKAWFPLTKRWLGFEDAHITFNVDGTGSAGSFESTILVDGAALSGPPLSSLAGRWSVDQDLVLTAITL